MPNALQTKSHADQIEQKKSEVLQPGIKRILWGGSGLLVLLLVFTFALPAGRILFFTGGLLSVVTLVIIALQAYIYSGQWKAMAEGLAIERAKTDPRLRVADVRVQNFEAGKSPVFLVTIANGGLIDATGVELQIGIRMDGDTAVDWSAEQIVTIPARGQEVYPVFSTSQLEQQHIDGFNSTVPLKVVGHFTYSPVGRKEFCYKYQPRNIFGLPQFAPCDFDPHLNTTLRIQGAVMKMTAGNVTLTVQKNPPEKSQPTKKAEPDGKEDSKPD
jgi:hypothetical protein